MSGRNSRRGAGTGCISSGYSTTCGHCGTSASSGEPLLLCGGCRSEYYCDAACQKAGWKAGHKTECKARQEKAKALLDERHKLAGGFAAIFTGVLGGLDEHRAQHLMATHQIPDVPTPEQPPLVPGGPVIRAGGGRNWKYKADLAGAATLMKAASHGDPHLLKQLLERGEDVHARVNIGLSALTCAVVGAVIASSRGIKPLQCIDLLLEHGADPNATDSLGQTAAHRCVAHAGPIQVQEAVLRKLLDAGADLSLLEIVGETPRMMATAGSPLHRLLGRLEVEYAAKRKAWKAQQQIESAAGGGGGSSLPLVE